MEVLEDILHKEMTRKEFLATVGFGLASLFGISAMARFLMGGKSRSSLQTVTSGYGASFYGGNPNTHKSSRLK
ncbi:MAG TPA: hypothetical protein VGS08_04670 [Candidatus Saccharimonadales bacterium]|nr:hypothetical protein [Candidatus Saccharimonadales bacterium]